MHFHQLWDCKTSDSLLMVWVRWIASESVRLQRLFLLILSYNQIISLKSFYDGHRIKLQCYIMAITFFFFFVLRDTFTHHISISISNCIFSLFFEIEKCSIHYGLQKHFNTIYYKCRVYGVEDSKTQKIWNNNNHICFTQIAKCHLKYFDVRIVVFVMDRDR